MKKFNVQFHFSAGTVAQCRFDDVVIAKVGDAKGHTTDEGSQIKADAKTLEMWRDIINANDKVAFRRNHTQDVMATIGKVVKGTAKVVGDALLASVELLPVAFTRAGDYIGEYLGQMSKDAPEFVNLSVESVGDLEPVEGGEVIRPTSLDAVALVSSGALTQSLYAFSEKKNTELQSNKINNKVEVNMAEEQKAEIKADEVKPEEIAKVADEVAKVADAVEPEKKAEEVEAKAITLESLNSALAEIKAMIGGLVEASKKVEAASEPVKAETAAQPVSITVAASKKSKAVVVHADDTAVVHEQNKQPTINELANRLRGKGK